MYNLVIYFKCVLVLTYVSYSKSCWRGVICYMLIRYLVLSKIRGEQLVLMVRILVLVFLQMFMGCLEKKCVLMIGDFE